MKGEESHLLRSTRPYWAPQWQTPPIHFRPSVPSSAPHLVPWLTCLRGCIRRSSTHPGHALGLGRRAEADRGSFWEGERAASTPGMEIAGAITPELSLLSARANVLAAIRQPCTASPASTSSPATLAHERGAITPPRPRHPHDPPTRTNALPQPCPSPD